MKTLTSAIPRRWAVAILFISVAWSPFVETAYGENLSESLWEYRADRDIKYFTLTSLGTVLVSTDRKTMALDPLTGSEVWVSERLRKCEADKTYSILLYCELEPLGKVLLLFVSLSNFGYLLGENGTAVVDLDTGVIPWVWDNSSLGGEDVDVHLSRATGNPVPSFAFAVTKASKRGTKIAAIRLADGHQAWVTDLPFVKGLGILNRIDSAGWRQDILILLGETDDDIFTMIGLDPASGSILWKQDGLQDEFDPVEEYLVEDSMVIIPSRQGPFSLDATTGDIRWRIGDYDSESGYCLFCSFYEKGRVIVVYDGEVKSIDTADGAILWRKKTPGASNHLMMTSAGLLVGCVAGGRVCGKMVELLDPTTGAALWPKPVEIHRSKSSTGNPVVLDESQNKMFFALDDHLYALNILDGSRVDLGSFDLDSDEVPNRIVLVENNVVVLSNQSMAGFSLDGGLLYEHYYKAPKSRGFWGGLGRMLAAQSIDMAISVALLATVPGARTSFIPINSPGVGKIIVGQPAIYPRITERFSANAVASNVIFTDEPDKAGNKGYSLVQIAYDDGREVGRAWVNKRAPSLVMDPFTFTVFAQSDDKEIVALEFSSSPEPE